MKLIASIITAAIVTTGAAVAQTYDAGSEIVTRNQPMSLIVAPRDLIANGTMNSVATTGENVTVDAVKALPARDRALLGVGADATVDVTRFGSAAGIDGLDTRAGAR